MQLTLFNIAFASEYDSNLIFLSQLREIGISYYNYSELILLRPREKSIRLVTRKKNLFICNTQIPSRKIMLVKGQNQPTYLLSKNSQIRLWHRKLKYVSNTRVVEASKLNIRIDIKIEYDYSIKNFFSNSRRDDNDEYKDLGQTFITNDKYERLFPLMAIINDPNNSEIKKLCDLCNERKHTMTIRHKKMILTTGKL